MLIISDSELLIEKKKMQNRSLTRQDIVKMEINEHFIGSERFLHYETEFKKSSQMNNNASIIRSVNINIS